MPAPKNKLRDVQPAALDAIVARHVAGVRRILTVLPTGAGKTVVFANLPRFLRQRGGPGFTRGARIGRVLVLAHRGELLTQAERTFRTWEPRASVSVFSGGRVPDLTDIHVLIASIQSISQPKTLESIAPDAFALIIIDEAHHATIGSAYTRVVNHFGGKTDSGALVHGYTATPNRADGETLQHLFDDIAYSCTVSDGMRQGWLCDTRYRKASIGADLLSVATRGDFNTRQLASLMDREEITCTVIGAYLNVRDEVRRWGMSPRAIGFAVSRAHAQHVVEAFRAANINAEYIGGDLDTTTRRNLLAWFREERFEVLVSVNLLLEGFDDDGINIAVDLKPTRSRVLAAQEFGRVVRKRVIEDPTTGIKTDLKPRAVYLQALPDHAVEAGMVTVPDVLGLKIDWSNADAVAALETMPLAAADQLDLVTKLRTAVGMIHQENGDMSIASSAEHGESAHSGEEKAAPDEWSEEERRRWILDAFASAPEEIVQLVYALPPEFSGSDFRWQTHLDRSIDLTLGDAGSLRIAPQDLLGRYTLSQTAADGTVSAAGSYEDIQSARDAAERVAVRDYPEAGRLYRKSLAEQWMHRPASEAARQRVRSLYPTIHVETLDQLTAGVASELIRLVSQREPASRTGVAA
ncbi:MAG: DEAD/DEAH box helicase [Gemmatimonadaceae bacterium]